MLVQMMCVDTVMFSSFKFVPCCEVFKAPFVAVMLSWAAVPSKNSCKLLFYNNVALIRY